MSAIYPLILERLPFEKYRELPGLNASLLIAALTSAKQYDHEKRNQREDNDTYRVGRAVHTATLEPLRFLKEYVLWDQGDRRGKAWEAFKVEHEGKTILKPEMYDPACAMAEAIRAHKVAGKLFAEQGRAELTIQWRHKSGVLCKSRLDWLCSALVDIKTASRFSADAFMRQAYELNYHVRMAFYLDACRAIGLDPPVKLVVVQKSAPHDVMVRPYDLAALDAGRAKYESAIELIQRCEKTGEWPGAADDEEVPVGLPHWALPDFDEEAVNFGEEAIV